MFYAQESTEDGFSTEKAGLVAGNFDPRDGFVHAWFAGQAKNLLAQDIAHDLACAALNGVCP